MWYSLIQIGLYLKRYFLPSRSIQVEKAMAPHSSTLAWKIPWTEEPGRRQSMELLRVGHGWVTSLSLFTFMLSDFTFTFYFHALEKEMATHSSVLAWSIPGTVEPGGLPSMGSHRVGHDWRNLANLATEITLGLKLLEGNTGQRRLINHNTTIRSCVKTVTTISGDLSEAIHPSTTQGKLGSSVEKESGRRKGKWRYMLTCMKTIVSSHLMGMILLITWHI